MIGKARLLDGLHRLSTRVGGTAVGVALAEPTHNSFLIGAAATAGVAVTEAIPRVADYFRAKRAQPLPEVTHAAPEEWSPADEAALRTESIHYQELRHQEAEVRLDQLLNEHTDLRLLLSPADDEKESGPTLSFNAKKAFAGWWVSPHTEQSRAESMARELAQGKADKGGTWQSAFEGSLRGVESAPLELSSEEGAQAYALMRRYVASIEEPVLAKLRDFAAEHPDLESLFKSEPEASVKVKKLVAGWWAVPASDMPQRVVRMRSFFERNSGRNGETLSCISPYEAAFGNRDGIVTTSPEELAQVCKMIQRYVAEHGPAVDKEIAFTPLDESKFADLLGTPLDHAAADEPVVASEVEDWLRAQTTNETPSAAALRMLAAEHPDLGQLLDSEPSASHGVKALVAGWWVDGLEGQAREDSMRALLSRGYGNGEYVSAFESSRTGVQNTFLHLTLAEDHQLRALVERYLKQL